MRCTARRVLWARQENRIMPTRFLVSYRTTVLLCLCAAGALASLSGCSSQSSRRSYRDQECLQQTTNTGGCLSTCVQVLMSECHPPASTQAYLTCLSACPQVSFCAGHTTSATCSCASDCAQAAFGAAALQSLTDCMAAIPECQQVQP
jgi:hypothetical protein